MNKKIFEYNLPEELIAQEPVESRDMSRLMVIDKATGDIKHNSFTNFVDYLTEGDCLVLNDTRVLPARLIGNKKNTGGKIEFVLIKRLHEDVWEVILKPGKRAYPGSRFIFGDGLLEAEVLSVLDGGNREVKFYYQGIFEEVLDKIGIVPLPPYIKKKLNDVERYQTVYSKYNGSAAAPTAGLHFTPEILQDIQKKGVNIAYITLHVGLGTFRPVKVDKIQDHKMHSENYNIDRLAADKINTSKRNGKRIVAVGTTSCRVLETVASEDGMIKECSGWTDIFIYPGYEFKCIDVLLTNFHLPGSTLIMLVCALGGTELIMNAYKEAIKNKYRFYSFGDAMLISQIATFKESDGVSS